MAKSVYDVEDYKKYLLLMEEQWSGRGMRTDLARALGCQPAYISQVLNGDRHLSLEQSEAATAFFGHSREEAHYFLLLVQFARAGTVPLRDYFRRQLDEHRDQHTDLKTRLGVAQTLTGEDQAAYYSAWYYPAIHVALTIPELQNAAKLAAYFGLDLEKVMEILEFMVATGLATREGNRYQIGTARIHLGKDSKLIANYHSHWRMRAIQSFDRSTQDDLHYSSVVTMSREDFWKLKEQLIASISDAKSVIRESPAEAVYVFNVDLFGLLDPRAGKVSSQA
jgi:uncharacterized protein (TIGR02147 family)